MAQDKSLQLSSILGHFQIQDLRAGKKQVTRRCPFICVPPNRFWALTIGQAFKGQGEGHTWISSCQASFTAAVSLKKALWWQKWYPVVWSLSYVWMHEYTIPELLWEHGRFTIGTWYPPLPRTQLRAVATQTADRSILNQGSCFLAYLKHILVSAFYLTLIPGMKGGTRVELSFHRCPWCPRGGCPVSGTNKRPEWFLPLLLQMTHACIVHWPLKALESNICYIHGHRSLCLAEIFLSFCEMYYIYRGM